MEQMQQETSGVVEGEASVVKVESQADLDKKAALDAVLEDANKHALNFLYRSPVPHILKSATNTMFTGAKNEDGTPKLHPPVKAINLARGITNRISRELESVVACKKGCSHCCKIGITVLDVEAQLIAKKYNLELGTPDPNNTDPIASRTNNAPCPFLANNECSVYSDRPMACRIKWNLSTHPELCDTEANPGGQIPNLNMGKFDDIFVRSVIGPETRSLVGRVADIREWFPTVVINNAGKPVNMEQPK